MYISSVSLNLNRKLLLSGVASVFLFSGCTVVRQPVQPYRDRPAMPETAQRQPGMSQPGRGSAPLSSPYQPSAASPVRSQKLPSDEQLAYKQQVLQPVRSTVRSRVAFYAQQIRSWQTLEQTSSRYRSPEQSRTLFSCRNKVSELHDAYTELQIQLFNFLYNADAEEKSIANFQYLQSKDFSYLEGGCPVLFKQLSTEQEEIAAPAENNIFQSDQPELGNVPEPGTRYEQPADGQEIDLLSLAAPEPAPDYEERYQQAQSLLKQGKEQEARRILGDLLASVRQTGNRTLQIKILKKTSELEFALRNYLAARIHYEELQQLNATFNKQHLIALQSVDSRRERVDAYAALLLSSMTSDPAQDGFTVVQQARAFIQNYPDSPLRSDAENLQVKAEMEAEEWFRQLLQQADRLAVNQQYPEALALLNKVPLDILPLDKQDIIQERKNALISPAPAQAQPPSSPPPVAAETDADTAMPDAATDAVTDAVSEPSPQRTERQRAPKKDTRPEVSVEQKTRSSPESGKKKSAPPEQAGKTALQAQWDKAENALQSAEYDKAIGLFSELLNTPLGTKARDRLEKASRSAGQEVRRKAANFFQRANSATNPEVRKQHLLSSKTLLEDILRKYPLAGLDAKVKRNLSRVDKELAALDHTPFE